LNVDLSDASTITVLLADGSRKTFGDDPGRRYLVLQGRFGALYEAKHFEQALPVADEMVAIARDALQGSPSHLAGALANRAELQRLLKKPFEAAVSLREVVPLMERSFGPDHANTRQTLRNLGNALAGAGAFGDALVVFHELLPRTERAAPDTMEHASDQVGAAAVGARAGEQHLQDSERLLQSAIAIASHGADVGLTLGRWWMMLGDLRVRLGWDGSRDCYVLGHQHFDAELGPNHALTLEAKGLLGG